MIRRQGLIQFHMLLCALLLVLCLGGCGKAPEADPAPAAPSADPLLTQDAEKIRISELMAKNRATLRDGDGAFPDWIELENISDSDVHLGGWRLADKADRQGWALPELLLPAGQRLLLYADGRDLPESLHTDFALSAGERVYLYNSHGYLVDSAPCGSARQDTVMVRGASDDWEESLYPTPGQANDAQGYAAWQSGLQPTGDLVINEVVVSNRKDILVDLTGGTDWVELRNISDRDVHLSDYCLSDDPKDYTLWRLPDAWLKPGELYLVVCDADEDVIAMNPICHRFSLDAQSETLYLAKIDGTLEDYAPLRDIPYGCSFGRMSGENGWFYFADSSPKLPNAGGRRRVSSAPAAAEPDGVFNGVDRVTVTLEGSGTIYYTTDGTLPYASGIRYTGPITLDKTGIVRAIAVEEDGIPSRPLTLSYILNENHSLPIVSLVSDEKISFYGMYGNGQKGVETPGSLSYYGEDGSFTLPCGIKMQGDTSLSLAKKNMSLRFRSSYGQARLDYDLFGGGVTGFSNLVLRAGQDYYSAIVRNELCQNLALASSDKLMAQRSRYCILYVDGTYSGIYALMEKANEQMYADQQGFTRDSVEQIDADSSDFTDLDTEVFQFCYQNDMSLDENYAHFCQLMDVDSLIDWFLLEGYCANGDLSYGNLRYVRSSEGDGKWRLVFYDLDATLQEAGLNYYNLLSPLQMKLKPISKVFAALMANEAFRDRFLSRAGELLNGPLSNESALAELHRLTEQIAPEVARDYARYDMKVKSWQAQVQKLERFLGEDDWRQHNIDTLCAIFKLDAQQRAYYFGD